MRKALERLIRQLEQIAEEDLTAAEKNILRVAREALKDKA